MKSKIQKRQIWAFGAVGLLSIFHIISRHDVLGKWHNMSDWPAILFAFGLVVIIIATFTFSRKAMICTPIGYMIGFILARIFNSDTYNEYDARYNNGWIIWMVAYLAIIAASIIWEIVSNRTKNKNITI
jgi:hypothetical protein